MATIRNGTGCACLAAFDNSATLKKHEIGRPAVSDTSVSIDISYCGMCHSDLHATNGDWGLNLFPMAPGHEVAGIVSAVGSKVTSCKVGDRVGVGCMVESCGSCDLCKSGDENYCPKMTQTYSSTFPESAALGNECGGMYTNGGYSSSITVNEKFVFHVPSNLSLEHTGPLLCAGITTYAPLNKYLLKNGGGAGKKVGILGFGGLGHMAVKIAIAMGCTDVVVLSRSKSKEAAAKELGATTLVHTDEEAVKAHTRTFDLVIDTVSAPHPIPELMSLLKVGGRWHLLGAVGKPIELSAMALIFSHYSMSGSLIGSVAETQEMLEFCAKHDIKPDIKVIPAKEANAQFHAMSEGTADAVRYVIDMSTLKDL